MRNQEVSHWALCGSGGSVWDCGGWRARAVRINLYRLRDRGVHGSFAGDHILLLLMGFAAERRANLDFLGTGGTAGPKIMGTISLSCIAHRRASAPTASAMEHC